MKIYQVNVDLGHCNFTGLFVVLPSETLDCVIENRFKTKNFKRISTLKQDIASIYLNELTVLDHFKIIKFLMEEGLN